MAALVISRQAAVDPNRGAIIDGAEVQQNAPALPMVRRLDAPAIPDLGVEGEIADAAQRALKAERNKNIAVERFIGTPPLFIEPNVGVIELKFPEAV